MHKFKNRIKYYLLGLLLGVFAVYFVFGSRSCEWLPENRAKNMIGEKEIIIGDSVLAVMNCMKLNNDDLYRLLKEEGEVEFSLSKTHQTPKIYYIEAFKNDAKYWANFALYEIEDYAEVISVDWENAASCSINISNSEKSALPLPHKDIIEILEYNEFRVLEKAECQMEFYGIEEADLYLFHINAEIDIKKSQPRLHPNPYYIMHGTLDNKEYSIKYIIGENRTRISEIRGKEKSDCSTEKTSEL